MSKYIGGDFPLDPNFLLSKGKFSKLLTKFPNNWSTSGRFMFYEILLNYKKKGIKKINLPSYICESLLEPVKKLGFSYLFYDVSDTFIINHSFKSNSLILIIHYFGKEIKNIAEIKNNIPSTSYIIEDITHTFLNHNCLNIKRKNKYFFTLRKHFGLLLGGYSNLKTGKNKKENKTFFEIGVKAAVLKYFFLKRNNKPDYLEKLYLNLFKQFENKIFLNYTKIKIPKQIKNLTSNINFQEAIKKRKKNWEILDEILDGKIEKLYNSYKINEVPLGYLIKIKNRDFFREQLKRKKIFTSIHWNLPKKIKKNFFPKSYKLSEQILTLPIDQRYDKHEIIYLGENILRMLKL